MSLSWPEAVSQASHVRQEGAHAFSAAPLGVSRAMTGTTAETELESLQTEVARLRRLNQDTEQRLEWSLKRLAENTRSLWAPSSVPRRPARGLQPLEFVRDFVAASQPVVLTGLTSREWPCLERWSDEYLLEAVGDTEVSVNVTPAGLGDYVDVATGLFVKPLEERMRFRDFWAWLLKSADSEETHAGDGVCYLSRQNDSLREELPGLLCDVPAATSLGTAAFGNEPEAINLWIGDGRAASTCHKDHYENLYMVVRGEKVFTLLPPAAVPFLHEQRCPPGHFERREGGGFHAVPDPPEEAGDMEVPWIPLDVSKPDYKKFPKFARATAVEVRVRRGEMLYLPAMWYHHVAQRGVTVAVNYWHDMPYGHAYIHHQFLRDVLSLNDDEVEDDEESLSTSDKCLATSSDEKS